MFIVAVLALGAQVAHCAVDGAPLVGTIASATQTGATSCDTSQVGGLTTQLLAELACERPTMFEPFDALSQFGVTWDAAVRPTLQTPVTQALTNKVTAQSGKTMHIISAVRSLAQQYILLEWKNAGQCNLQSVAAPGSSGHEEGKDIDLRPADKTAWKDLLTPQFTAAGDASGFRYAGSPAAVSLAGESVKAFQRLWNVNNPSDLLTVDGVAGTETLAKLAASPADGFSKVACEKTTTPRPANLCASKTAAEDCDVCVTASAGTKARTDLCTETGALTQAQGTLLQVWSRTPVTSNGASSTTGCPEGWWVQVKTSPTSPRYFVPYTDVAAAPCPSNVDPITPDPQPRPPDNPNEPVDPGTGEPIIPPGCDGQTLGGHEHCEQGGLGCTIWCTCSEGWESTNPISRDCTKVCGNGRIDLESHEECDKGLGCQADCRCGEGYGPTSPHSKACVAISKAPTCGNRRLDPEYGEHCDGGSGCDPFCHCTGAHEPTNPYTLGCKTRKDPPVGCGNGLIDLDLGEECDGGDGCSTETCKCLEHYEAHYPTKSLSCRANPPAGCNNFYLQGQEECDRGFGCSPVCTCPEGFAVTEPRSTACQEVAEAGASTTLGTGDYVCIKQYSLYAQDPVCSGTTAFSMPTNAVAAKVLSSATITDCGATWIQVSLVSDANSRGWVDVNEIGSCSDGVLGGICVNGVSGTGVACQMGDESPEEEDDLVVILASVFGGLCCLYLCISLCAGLMYGMTRKKDDTKDNHYTGTNVLSGTQDYPNATGHAFDTMSTATGPRSSDMSHDYAPKRMEASYGETPGAYQPGYQEGTMLHRM